MIKRKTKKMNRKEIESRLIELKQEKKQLKKQLKELPNLEVGKWITDNSSYWDSMLFITKINGSMFEAYGLDCKGRWVDCTYLNLSSYRPATDKEVETALIAEAKKRGFKDGVRFKGVAGVQSNEEIQIGEKRPIKFGFANSVLGLYCENSWIFRKGKWAEIIKPKTVHIPSGDYTETQVKDILNNKFNK